MLLLLFFFIFFLFLLLFLFFLVLVLLIIVCLVVVIIVSLFEWVAIGSALVYSNFGSNLWSGLLLVHTYKKNNKGLAEESIASTWRIGQKLSMVTSSSAVTSVYYSILQKRSLGLHHGTLILTLTPFIPLPPCTTEPAICVPGFSTFSSLFRSLTFIGVLFHFHHSVITLAAEMKLMLHNSNRRKNTRKHPNNPGSDSLMSV